MPEESTLHKTYVGHYYNNIISDLQNKLANLFMWLSVDKSTDPEGCFIANVIVSALKCVDYGPLTM